MRNNVKSLLESYDLGLRLGDTESAMFAIYNYSMMRFLTGAALEGILTDCMIYGKQMKDLKRDQALYPNKLLEQMCLNLVGEGNDENLAYLQGDALTEADFVYYGDHPSFVTNKMAFEGMLLTFFGRHVECADIFLKEGVDAWDQANVSFGVHMWTAFLRGVSFYAAAQQTRKSKYLKVARRMKKRLIGWQKQGNPNLVFYISCLEGEEMWFKGKYSQAIPYFEATIIKAVRAGHLHDAGLASERLSQLHREMGQYQDEVQYRMKQAIGFYREWGALAKVDQLLKEEGKGEFMPKAVDLPSALSISSTLQE